MCTSKFERPETLVRRYVSDLDYRGCKSEVNGAFEAMIYFFLVYICINVTLNYGIILIAEL